MTGGDADGSFVAYGELTKQILTLSTAVLALTVTFLTDVVEALSGIERLFLSVAWLLYVLSIVSGVLVLMAMAGALHCIEHPDDPRCAQLAKPISIYSLNVRATSWMQVMSFFLATGSLITFGALEL